MRAEIMAWVLEACATLIRRSDGSLPDWPVAAFGTICALTALFIGAAMAWQGLWRVAGLFGLAPREANAGSQIGSAFSAAVAVGIGVAFGSAGAMALWGLAKYALHA